jgi:hypothetical protein
MTSWIKLYLVGYNWNTLDQIGSKQIELDQIGLILITKVLKNMVLTKVV